MHLFLTALDSLRKEYCNLQSLTIQVKSNTEAQEEFMNMVNTLVTYRYRVEGDRRKLPLDSENCQIIPVEFSIT